MFILLRWKLTNVVKTEGSFIFLYVRTYTHGFVAREGEKAEEY